MNTNLSASLKSLRKGWRRLNLAVSAPERVACWDTIVITASNVAQAQLYASELDRSKKAGYIPESVVLKVIPDIEGRRIGSGGATLNALRDISENHKVMLVHSGGDSKRLPWAGVFGKLFIPFPVLADPDGRCPTLFDHLLALSMLLLDRTRSEEGLIFSLTGDVLPICDFSRLDIREHAVNVITHLSDYRTASHHGVFKVVESGVVSQILQKPDLNTLIEQDVLVDGGRAYLDTGLFVFTGSAQKTLLRAANHSGIHDLLHSKTFAGISLYEEIAAAFVPAAKEWLVKQPAGEILLELAAGQVMVAQEAKDFHFVHLGTGPELQQHLTSDWLGQVTRKICSKTHGEVPDSAVIISSRISEKAKIGQHAILSGVHLRVPCEIGRSCMLFNIDTSESFSLDDHHCLWRVPLKLEETKLANAYLCCGVYDDFKAEGLSATFCNRSMAQWLKQRKLKADEVWSEGGNQSLWNAKLFPVNADCPMALLEYMTSHQPDSEMSRLYQSIERKSLSEVASSFDPENLIKQRVGMEVGAASARLQSILRNESEGDINWLSKWLAENGKNEELKQSVDSLHRGTRSDARMKSLQSLLHREHKQKSKQYADEAVDAVKTQLELFLHDTPQRSGVHIAAGISKIVELPVRFDIAGGWTDTPPISMEIPSRVLNFSVMLNGQCPVGVEVESLKQQEWHFESEINNRKVVLNNSKDHGGDLGLADPYLLVRTALKMLGYGNETHIIQGVRVRTWSRVPRGSGLGTSSVLGAAVVSALLQLMNESHDDNSIIEAVLKLEQLMTTGGGWQDQVGGLIPGVKLIECQPVSPMKLTIHKIPLLPSVQKEFEARFVLAHTGIERLAKNILQIVVNRYLSHDKNVIRALEELYQLAGEGAQLLSTGKLDDLGLLLSEVWEVHQSLDPHCSNPAIDHLFRQCEDYVVGGKLAGAGGGGFVGMMAKDEDAVSRIAHFLKQEKTFCCEIG